MGYGLKIVVTRLEWREVKNKGRSRVEEVQEWNKVKSGTRSRVEEVRC